MTPWVETYRPTTFEALLMSPENRVMFKRLLEEPTIPNILVYGPPGTGKTSAVSTLILSYQKKHGEEHRGLVMQLNASDDRGVDVIREQICRFVHSKSFWGGRKFVVLDEVDYMTKQAQQALVYTMQGCNATFCLMCNYICKMDDSVQDRFLKVKFNRLPEGEVLGMLRRIVDAEKVEVDDAYLRSIHSVYGSDVRSMINYLQAGRGRTPCVARPVIWEEILEMVHGDNINNIQSRMNRCSLEYNLDTATVLKDFLYYVLKTRPVPLETVQRLQLAMHLKDAPLHHVMSFVILSLM